MVFLVIGCSLQQILKIGRVIALPFTCAAIGYFVSLMISDRHQIGRLLTLFRRQLIRFQVYQNQFHPQNPEDKTLQT